MNTYQPLVKLERAYLAHEDLVPLDIVARHGQFALAEHIPKKKFLTNTKLSAKPTTKKERLTVSRQTTTSRSASCVSQSSMLNCRPLSVLPKVDDLPQDEGDGCEYVFWPDFSLGHETPKFSNPKNEISLVCPGRSATGQAADHLASPNETVINLVAGMSPSESRSNSRSRSLRKSSKSRYAKKEVRSKDKYTIIHFISKL